MNVSTLKVSVPEAMSVEVTEDTLTAELSDGRTVSVPLSWYPRLIHATPGGTPELAADRRGRGYPLARLG